jgi:pimeloyl-ACP methyl ester carboxylesterase
MSKRILKKALTFFFILSLIFSPFQFSNFQFGRPEALGMIHAEISANETWEGEKIIANWLTITNGAIITIKKGTKIKFAKDGMYVPTLTVSNGQIIAEGTKDEKITFTTNSEDDEYAISFSEENQGKRSFFRHVTFENGGYLLQFVKNKSFLNTAYAQGGGVSALSINSGQLHFENCEFKNNKFGAVNFSTYEIGEEINNDPESYLEIVNSNFTGNGLAGETGRAVSSNANCYVLDDEAEDVRHYNCNSRALLKNNWYGHSSGPLTEPNNESEEELEGEGEIVMGDFVLEGWRKNDLIFDPVIIIPGIMGSAPKNSKNSPLVLDPIMHTYKNLAASFLKNGYTANVNYFEFPYEWRNENAVTAEKLAQKIEEVRNESKISKVDLVAHSMGGLIARHYIESSNYDEDIDQLITLGTPHRGSPEAYLKWEAGEGFFTILDSIAKKLFQIEAFHSGHFYLKDYIQEEVKSVGELLPIYDYLFKISDDRMKEYPYDYPKNTFLENLNKEENVSKLSKVKFYNIVGDTGKDETISKFRVVDSFEDGMWIHGMPENFYKPYEEKGIEYVRGDRTVPLSSASVDYADKTEKLEHSHSDLPTKAQRYVISELTGMDYADCEYVSTSSRIRNLLTFGVFSPIDIQIISPDGKWAGKNIQNLKTAEIPGAFYSGHDTENEFLTVPNPENGEYQIITEGTGNGEFKIEIAKISENENGEAFEISSEISGVAQEGITETIDINLQEDKILTEEEEEERTPTIETLLVDVQKILLGWSHQQKSHQNLSRNKTEKH